MMDGENRNVSSRILRFLVSVLGDLGISHMLVGSHASSFYGEARSTHDVDLVIDLDSAKIPALVARFDPDRYYLSETALREGRMAYLIDTLSGDKVDCFILGSDPIDRLSFSRRRSETIMGIEVALASPEDTILAKLRWGEMSGGSSQQQSDVREIFRQLGESLDVVYLRTQATQMGILSQLNEFWMLPEKREHQIAMETEAGHEGLAVWRRVVRSMTGPQKVAKAFELTELTRQIMRAGIRRQHADARESEIHEMYVDRLLQYHGTSLAEVRQKQREQATVRMREK